MFPESQYSDSSETQIPIYQCVPLTISLQFSHPISVVLPWDVAALLASVPEASVNEDRQHLLREKEIWAAKHFPVEYPSLHSPPNHRHSQN
jgi:hypothetical protein